ncbi:glycoside hydrolase family 26 protein [Streptomyces sp. NPDC001380]|uniref:glycoside hydrolase family 26 protein n=1 Tax=Streptomyces sp. NPDC001380 TaxID=3364566 RepID=UPI0036C80A95
MPLGRLLPGRPVPDRPVPDRPLPGHPPGDRAPEDGPPGSRPSGRPSPWRRAALRTPSGRPERVAAALLLLAAAAVPLALVADRAPGPQAADPAVSADGLPSSDGPDLTAVPDHDVPFGAFLGSWEDGVRSIGPLAQWLHGADVRVGHTYLAGNDWSDIEGDTPALALWSRWRQADPDRMLVLNVPLQAGNEDGVGDAEVRDLIHRGADGEFDGHFLTLARRLVDLGAGDTVLVLGWEMNGTTYTHRCGPDPEAWRGYWRRVVGVMRSVPGQRFRFDFAPSRGLDAVPWTHCYPGDDVVDVIGMDSYDQDPGDTFDDYVAQPYGLRRQVEFAAAHRKPVSYPEWGLFRHGDDPEFVRRMVGWIRTHDTLYQTATDYCPHGFWQCGENPRSSEVYRELLSARPGASSAASPEDSPGPRP